MFTRVMIVSGDIHQVSLRSAAASVIHTRSTQRLHVAADDKCQVQIAWSRRQTGRLLFLCVNSSCLILSCRTSGHFFCLSVHYIGTGIVERGWHPSYIMMIVWRIRVVGTVLCCVVYDSCSQWCTHVYEQFLQSTVGLGLLFVCFSVSFNWCHFLCFFCIVCSPQSSLASLKSRIVYLSGAG